MALVEYRVAGAGADQHADERLLQIGPYHLLICQRPADSGSARHLAEGPRIEWPEDDEEDAQSAAGGRKPDLSNVGLVVWSSGYVLADLLLRRAPMGAWPGVRVLELGSGTGICGMFLAAAGARVVLTDLPHITPLTRKNVATNCSSSRGAGAATATASAGCCAPGAPLVVDYSWGEPRAVLFGRIASSPSAAAAVGVAGAHGSLRGVECAGGAMERVEPEAGGLRCWGSGQEEFDMIVGADLLYDPEVHGVLLKSLGELAAPHTQVHLCYRRRGLGEEGFEAAASSAGWAVQEVPLQLLHPEFQGGEYRALVMCRL